jgi:hypothetical protein
MGCRGEILTDNMPRTRPAQSASPTDQRSFRHPEGALMDYSFVVLDDVSADSLTLRKITNFEVEPCVTREIPS